MDQKNKKMDQEYVKTMLENNLFAVVYPIDKSKESALKLVDIIDSAVGVAEFKDENNVVAFGVLIDKIKEAKKSMKIKEEQEKE